MNIPTSNPIANKKALTDAVQLIVRASNPTTDQLIAAGAALAQVMADVLGINCKLKLIVEPQK